MDLQNAADLIPERDFQRTVVEMARSYGWKVYGVIDRKDFAKRYDKGFPDLVMVRDGHLIFAELKSQAGSLSVDQDRWLTALGNVSGVRVYEWRPSQRDEIDRILQ